MEIHDIEQKIIDSFKDNIKMSKEEDDQGPEEHDINSETAPFRDICGFDSMRMLEMIVELEAAFGCEIPEEKFLKEDPQELSIRKMSGVLKEITEGNQ